MRVTQMRKAVRTWLRYERATRLQALRLLEAIYAGAIHGNRYAGHRRFHGGPEVEKAASLPGVNEYGDNNTCGCLVDTLERARHVRGVGEVYGSAAVTFELARKIPLGATPDSNGWARAAVQGIEDYYIEKGWR